MLVLAGHLLDEAVEGLIERGISEAMVVMEESKEIHSRPTSRPSSPSPPHVAFELRSITSSSQKHDSGSLSNSKKDDHNSVLGNLQATLAMVPSVGISKEVIQRKHMQLCFKQW